MKMGLDEEEEDPKQLLPLFVTHSWFVRHCLSDVIAAWAAQRQ